MNSGPPGPIVYTKSLFFNKPILSIDANIFNDNICEASYIVKAVTHQWNEILCMATLTKEIDWKQGAVTIY